MALVVAKHLPDSWAQRAGLALDAAHNLQQQYKIDRRRIYVMGGADQPGPDGVQALMSERVGLNYPEVFTGTISFGVNAFMKVKAVNGAFYPPKMPPPSAAAQALARTRPIVFAPINADDYFERTAKAFTQSGYQHVKYQVITLEQIHYPHYQAGWLPDFLKYMDDATAKLKLEKEPSTKATKP